MGLQPGERFGGRYELVAPLGHGGMAETWRARLLGAAGVTKPVLIKRILREYATDEAFTSMFISEARISATLSHGNIAQVYDFGEVDGEYFLAMEYVEGQPLHRIIKRTLRMDYPALPMPLATFIAIEMCRGLHYAHTRTSDTGKPLGIVHRDISPDNVLISYEGQVKLVDFGIAKARALRTFNTAPGVVKGKYLFFSPEQARGEDVDGRTDVWATAVVLYELLCGRLPVEGPEYVALPKLIHGAFPRPSLLRPGLPAELDKLIMKALAVKREERFESSHVFGDALTGFLYASTPRFSAMSLSHFVQELFREELSREGRAVQVPASFVEELALWRIPSTTPGHDRAPEPRPLSSTETQPLPPLEDAGPTQAPRRRRRSRRRRVLAALAAVVVAGTTLAAVRIGPDKLFPQEARAWLMRLVETPPGPLAAADTANPAPGTPTPSAPAPTGTARNPPAPPAPPSPPPVSATGSSGSQAPRPGTPPASPRPPPAPPMPGRSVSELAEDARELMKQRAFTDAEAVLTRCLEIDPNYTTCRSLYAMVLSELGQPARAMEQQRNWLRLHPTTRPRGDP